MQMTMEWSCHQRLAPLSCCDPANNAKEETRAQVLEHCEKLAQEIRDQNYDGKPVRVELDDRDLRGGEKMWQWVKKGIPLTVEVGPRDLESDSVFVGRRDLGPQERSGMPRAKFVEELPSMLQEMQNNLHQKAHKFQKANTVTLDTKEDFYDFFAPRDEIHGGFALALGT